VSTFSDRRQLATPQNAQIQKTAKLGVFAARGRQNAAGFAAAQRCLRFLVVGAYFVFSFLSFFSKMYCSFRLYVFGCTWCEINYVLEAWLAVC